MKNIKDISVITNNSYRIAEIINGGHYDNILYYEFHERVNPKGIHNCIEGLESFKERSNKYYKIFLSHGFVDEEPARINIAVKISDQWFIARDCGSNYYLGYGPRGILKLREACMNKNVLGIVSEESLDIWLKQNFNSSILESINKKENIDLIQFDKLIKSLRFLAADMQRRPEQFIGLKEENIRDRMLTPINMVFEGRGNAEAKNCKGKTDILVRTSDGLNEHIFELKVWGGIKDLIDGIKQLKSYLSWHNNYSGIIMFCYNSNFTEILKKVEQYLSEKLDYDKREKFIPNEFRFKLTHPTDEYKTVETHLILINLKIK